MTKIEVETLLMKNGYTKHPVFQFYCIPKKKLGYYFFVKEDVVNYGKIKWDSITLTDVKEVKTKTFIPHNFGLITDLDLKQRGEMMKRMALNKQKHAAKLKDGYFDVEQEDFQAPETNIGS